jgi:hypothetical protein
MEGGVHVVPWLALATKTFLGAKDARIVEAAARMVTMSVREPG